MKKPLTGILISFLLCTNALSQYYDTGNEPASVKWLQIESGNFRVIYPASFGDAGVSFAKQLISAEREVSTLFPGKKFSIPVVIHSLSTVSNGYVAWAPKRMEIYPLAEQDGIPGNSDRSLALHELTHVYQMQSLNAGLVRLLSFVAGEQVTGAAAAMLPMWYMEGHAVYAESVLSGSGRARAPSFEKGLKAITLEKGSLYSFDKMINSSYRDFIPDHYQLGYPMVAWSLYKYDPQIWNQIIRFTANQPFTVNPVNIKLYNSWRLTKKRLFKETYDTLSVAWKKDIELKGSEAYPELNSPRNGKFISYHSPVVVGTDSLLAIKTSLSNPAQIVLINTATGKEKYFHSPGNIWPRKITAGNKSVVWVEERQDPRWENRSYSVIMSKPLRTGMVKQLTYLTRYLAAAISPDGKSIAAIENTIDNRNNLVILDGENGKLISSNPSPGNSYLQQPVWSASGDKITLTALAGENEIIIAFDPESGRYNTLLETINEDIGSSFLKNDTLWYESSASGTENIWRLAGGKREIITNSRFGTGEFCFNGNNLIFSDYTSGGNSICTVSVNDLIVNNLTIREPAVRIIDKIENPVGNIPEENEPELNPVPYRKSLHLLKFHSWMPFYADIEAVAADPASIRPGVTLFSQNVLSSLITSVGYEYSADKSHLLHSKVTWKGWYPVLESQIDYNTTRFSNPDSSGLPAFQSNYTMRNSISLPLNFSYGAYNQSLYAAVTSDYISNSIQIPDQNIYDAGQATFTYRLYYTIAKNAAYRDIYPKFAQLIDISYTNSPFDEDLYGSSLSFRGALYLPGLLKNNSLRLRLEVEEQNFSRFLTSNKIRFPRGYTNIISEKLKTITGDYALPLAYPDLNISSLLYLKRLRASLFFDWSEGTNNFFLTSHNGSNVIGSRYPGTIQFRSYGTELLADLHLFRIPYMITTGVQVAIREDKSKPDIEFVLRMNIEGMTIGGKNGGNSYTNY